jgi:hypothetical protein
MLKGRAPMFGGTPFRLLSPRWFSGCSFCCGFFRSSFCCGSRQCSFCSGSSPSSSGFFRHCRFRLRLLLCAGEWRHPSALLRTARPSIARQRPCVRPYATRSWCSSFPDPIHSSYRRRLPYSPSPKRAVPPHVVRHHASRSLPRCVRLSAAACWCKTTCRPVAWS